MTREDLIDAAARRVRERFPLLWRDTVSFGALWAPFLAERVRAEWRRLERLRTQRRDLRGRYA